MEIKCRLRVILAEKEVKEGKKITQGEFADKVQISKAALSALINNRALPTLEVAYRISEVLDLPVEEIWVKKSENPTSS